MNLTQSVPPQMKSRVYLSLITEILKLLQCQSRGSRSEEEGIGQGGSEVQEGYELETEAVCISYVSFLDNVHSPYQSPCLSESTIEIISATQIRQFSCSVCFQSFV